MSNTIFFTQGLSLKMFYDLMLSMKAQYGLGKVGFYVTDSAFFNKFSLEHPEFKSGKFYILKEWEIIRDSKSVKPDIGLLAGYEKKIGKPYLWDALVADRRIYWGKRYAYAQDYHPRFNHERMMAILQVGIKRIEELFNNVLPDFIVSFQCVTLGDYLSYLIARERNVRVLNLQPMRVRNYFYANDGISILPKDVLGAYERYMKDGFEGDVKIKEEASKYINDVRGGRFIYEGVVRKSKTNLLKKALVIKEFLGALLAELKFRFSEYTDDNHRPGYLAPFIGTRFTRPWRAMMIDRRLKKVYVNKEELSSLNYAFFPLHTEPEVALCLYSKTFLNQIEAIRLVSHNLPVGMKLIVKDHPCSLGKRTFGYYRKILDIPNVMLAHHDIQSKELLLNAQMVVSIAGSIGFEGMILNKPVIALGGVTYSFLPRTMMRHVTNPASLGDEVKDLLENYKCDDKALTCYVAAVMKECVPVDFYSRLLARENAYNFNELGDAGKQKKERSVHMQILAQYLAWKIKK